METRSPLPEFSQLLGRAAEALRGNTRSDGSDAPLDAAQRAAVVTLIGFLREYDTPVLNAINPSESI